MKLSSIHLICEMTKSQAMQIFQIDNIDKSSVLAKYRKLSVQYHPDRQDGDQSKMKKINQAFFILTGKEQPEPETPIENISPEEKAKRYLELWKEATKILEQKHSTIFNNCRRAARGDAVIQQENSTITKEIIEKLDKGIRAVEMNKLHKWQGVQIISKSYVQLLQILYSSIKESRDELSQLKKSSATVQGEDYIEQSYYMIIEIHKRVKMFLKVLEENSVKAI